MRRRRRARKACYHASPKLGSATDRPGLVERRWLALDRRPDAPHHPPPLSTADPYASLRFPEYRAFLAAMTAIFVATQIQSAMLGWQVYLLTNDPFALGLVGLVKVRSCCWRR